MQGSLGLCFVAFACLPLAAQTVTYTRDIAPILFERCAPCHRPGEAAPFSLLTYADAKRHGASIEKVTRDRYMPPWMPVPGHDDFAGSPRLSDRQIALIANWVRSAMPEGNPADLPVAPHFTEGWQLGKPDLIVSMAEPYPLRAAGSDVFRNFVLQTGLTETKYIRAFELRPGNKRVVHHANIVVDRSRLLRRRDGEDGQPGFGGMDVETEVTGEFDPDSHFLFWKPGSPAQREPEDMAWKLDPGSDLILNLHLQPSGKPETIDAEVGLYFTKRTPALHPMLLQLEHDGAIDIPAGSDTFAVTDRLTLPVALSLLAIYPHAHYLGKQIEAWAEFPDGARRPLLKIDRWDINWQAIYTYKEPVRLPAGTTVAMRIGYDNTSANPRNPNHPPKKVVSGNRAEDEMGHVWLQVLPEAQGEGDARFVLQKAVMRRRIEKYPADFVAHFNLGAALQAEGKPEEAQPYLARAVSIRPSNATARNNLAAAYFASERFDQAAKEFREALRLDPGYENARYNLARTLSAQGTAAARSRRFAEALGYFREAVELQPDDVDFLTNLGAALASTGDLAGAAPVLERALKADPSNSVARDNLARLRQSIEGKRP